MTQGFALLNKFDKEGLSEKVTFVLLPQSFPLIVLDQSDGMECREMA
jgi:hypothetical protein